MDWKSLESLGFNDNVNLWSYVTLKGAYIESLKWIYKQVSASAGNNVENKIAEEKKKLIDEIVIRAKRIDIGSVIQYLKSIREALIVNGYNVKVCRIKTSYRTLVGSGEPFGKVPFEVGLSFDPLMNVPIIPASSLKGSFRNALWSLLRKTMDDEYAERLSEIVFGSNEHSGLVGLTDAYPVEANEGGFILMPDVLTPHYPGAETELDVSPNPVPFLTVAEGVVFEFYIFYNKDIYQEESRKLGDKAKRKHAIVGDVTLDVLVKNSSTGNFIDDALRNSVFHGDLSEAIETLSKMGLNPAYIIPWIDRAVLYASGLGIGAKTSIGYSRFEVIEYRSLEG